MVLYDFTEELKINSNQNMSKKKSIPEPTECDPFPKSKFEDLKLKSKEIPDLEFDELTSHQKSKRNLDQSETVRTLVENQGYQGIMYWGCGIFYNPFTKPIVAIMKIRSPLRSLGFPQDEFAAHEKSERNSGRSASNRLLEILCTVKERLHHTEALMKNRSPLRRSLGFPQDEFAAHEKSERNSAKSALYNFVEHFQVEKRLHHAEALMENRSPLRSLGFPQKKIAAHEKSERNSDRSALGRFVELFNVEKRLHHTEALMDFFIKNRNVIYILGLINQMIAFCSGSSLVFLYLLLIIPFGVCDDFLLSYRHTGVYNPEENQYSFDTSGYVNDKVIDKYRSDISMDIPMVSWMEKNEEDAYWERQTALRRGWEKVFKDNLLILASRFNYTKRYHTLQLMYGCTLRDDNSSTGYYQYGFDGRDFLILDKDTLLWIPGTQKAEISAQRWNSDRDISEGVKVYLTEHCTSALKKYISYGREELEKRVAPEVKVWGIQKSDGITRLQCLVYGFHPRPVDVKWVRNGEDQLLSDEMSPILPHPDGTYQIRVSVEVITREGDTYSCHVDHSSLGEETLSVQWEPVSASISMIVGIVTAVVLVTVILVVALLIVRKQRKLKEIF